MKRPLFAISEIVDFVGNRDAAPAWGVEVIQMQYFGGTTAALSVRGEAFTPIGWFYTLSNEPTQCTAEGNLRKRPDMRVSWEDMVNNIKNPEYGAGESSGSNRQ